MPLLDEYKNVSNAFKLADPKEIIDRVYDQVLLNDLSYISLPDWADRYRLLSTKSSAEPGPWTTDRTPYWREVMEELSPRSKTQRVVVMKCSQSGWTEVLNNCAGMYAHKYPCPILFMLPTSDLAQKFSNQRFKAMVDATDVVAEKMLPEDTSGSARKKKKSKMTDQVKMKEFVGGIIYFVSAKSIVDLKSVPIRILLCDEIDEFEKNLHNQGNPIKLASVRTSTFESNKKEALGSSPTIDGESNIQAEFKKGDQRYYYVPCPHCGVMQVLKWKRLKYTINDKNEVLDYWYECEAGQCRIEEHQKTKMLEAGKWIPHNPDEKEIKSYHVNFLMLPYGWYGWLNGIKEFLEATKNNDIEALKVFVNTRLGECWKDTKSVVDWKRLYNRKDSYKRGTVPRGGLFLTAGVDVQADRLECEVVAWGRKNRSWSIDNYVFKGDTTQDEVWKNLKVLLDRSYKHEAGIDLEIRLMAVDCGFNTQRVYRWINKMNTNRLIGIKGYDSGEVFGRQRKVELKDMNGGSLGKIASYWPINTAQLKEELYQYLALEKDPERKDDPEGYLYFPTDYDTEYFKQLTAEHKIETRTARGRVIKWEKIKQRRNEALDCRIYARACASILGYDLLDDVHFKELENDLEKMRRLQTITADSDINQNVKFITEGYDALDKEKEKENITKNVEYTKESVQNHDDGLIDYNDSRMNNFWSRLF